MPKKKPVRDPNQLSDRDILREVFPERVIDRIDEELKPLKGESDRSETLTNRD